MKYPTYHLSVNMSVEQWALSTQSVRWWNMCESKREKERDRSKLRVFFTFIHSGFEFVSRFNHLFLIKFDFHSLQFVCEHFSLSFVCSCSYISFFLFCYFFCCLQQWTCDVTISLSLIEKEKKNGNQKRTNESCMLWTIALPLHISECVQFIYV